MYRFVDGGHIPITPVHNDDGSCRIVWQYHQSEGMGIYISNYVFTVKSQLFTIVERKERKGRKESMSWLEGH